MKTRFSVLVTATTLMFSLPACAASTDVDLLSYDGITTAPVIAPPEPQPDAMPVELTPPVVTETTVPEKKPEPVKPKIKKAAAPKPKPVAAKPAPAVKEETKEEAKEEIKQEVKKPEPTPAPAKAAAPQIPLLKAGDIIRIDVKDEPDLSGSYPIAADGTLALPLIGNKQAAGLTLIDLKTALTAAYKDGYLVDPKLSLSKEVSP